MDCLFCQIINGKVPSYKVYEDDKVFAFLDIAPVNYGHTLVVPKKHFANLEEIDEEYLSAVILAVKKIGASIKKNLGVEAYNATVNNGELAGQVINHLHFHIIPRHKGDNLKLWPQGKYKDGEAEEVLNKIKIS